MSDKKQNGKIVIISGFSGVGKGTVVKKLKESFDHYAVSVSMTTRKPRNYEKHGVDYYFVSKDEFEDAISRDGFLEHAKYSDNYYGTPKAFVEDNLENGNDVILEIEVQGAEQIMKKHPDTISIFLAAPSAGELLSRLKGRGSEDTQEIIKRLRLALKEAEKMKYYDYIVINGDLDKCVHDLDRIILNGSGDHRYDPKFKDRFVKDLIEIIEERKNHLLPVDFGKKTV